MNFGQGRLVWLVPWRLRCHVFIIEIGVLGKGMKVNSGEPCEVIVEYEKVLNITLASLWVESDMGEPVCVRFHFPDKYPAFIKLDPIRKPNQAFVFLFDERFSKLKKIHTRISLKQAFITDYNKMADKRATSCAATPF